MKIAVLLSGGVDSSVVLALLKDQGHEVTAFYLKIWLEDEAAFLGDCPWQEDLAYARAVCRQLDVPLEVLSMQSEYYERVVRYALDELKAGRTPSSDIFCNQRIKFGVFYDHLDDGFEKVATGHYAGLRYDGQGYHLLKGRDPVKDQTYFLSHLSQAQLQRALFLLGDTTKAEVRDLARDFRLPTQQRKDSQGICFLGKIDYDEFVRFNLGEQPGDIVEWPGDRVLGTHRGHWFYTIGQRQGLRLSGGPWYVVGKDIERRIVYVTHAERLTQTSRDKFEVTALHWITGEPSQRRLQVKLRHGPTLTGCRWEARDAERWEVLLDEPDAGIAPGQFAVFYHNEECLGAGMIN